MIYHSYSHLKSSNFMRICLSTDSSKLIFSGPWCTLLICGFKLSLILQKLFNFIFIYYFLFFEIFFFFSVFISVLCLSQSSCFLDQNFATRVECFIHFLCFLSAPECFHLSIRPSLGGKKPIYFQ